MIQPNAKCVVNGNKVNEIALWVNQFIALKNEELDVVDANNTPAKRWFLTGGVPGGVGSAGSGDRDNLGGTGHGAAGTGGGASGNRDQLNTGATSGIPLDTGGGNQNGDMIIDNGGPKVGGFRVAAGSDAARQGFDDTPGDRPMLPKDYADGRGFPGGEPKVGGFRVAAGSDAARQGFDDTPGGRPMLPKDYANGGGFPGPGGGGAFGGGTDESGNELYADGTRVTPGGRPMLPKDYADGRGFPGGTTPPPKPGAPPLGGGAGTGGDSTARDKQTTLRSMNSALSEAATDLTRLERQLREAKADDKFKWDIKRSMWMPKQPNDPPSPRVVTLEKRVEAARKLYDAINKAQNKQ